MSKVAIATVLALSLSWFAVGCAGPAPTGAAVTAAATTTPAPVTAVIPGSTGLYGFVIVVIGILGVASFMIVRGDKPATM